MITRRSSSYRASGVQCCIAVQEGKNCSSNHGTCQSRMTSPGSLPRSTYGPAVGSLVVRVVVFGRIYAMLTYSLLVGELKLFLIFADDGFKFQII